MPIALAALAGSALVASAQEPATPTAGRPFGGASSPSSPTGTGLSNPGLTLPPGYIGNSGVPAPAAGAAPAAGPQNPTTGSARRPGLRDNRARRSRQPASLPVQGGFRPTLIAPEIAANVQPVQTGVPDPALPARPVRRPLVSPLTLVAAPSAIASAGLAGSAGAAGPAGPITPVTSDPYAPLGVRVGNIHLFPVLGESIGYDTNPNRTERNRRGSFVSQTEGELGIQSDWSRHELTGFLRGAYNVYPSNPEANRPEGAGRLGLRLDATRDTQFDVEGHYRVDTQRPGSPDLNALVSERPIVYTEGASAGVTQRFNRLIASIRGTIDRADYEDARIGNGVVIDQSDRNLTSYGVKARLGYELSPGFVPFAEAFADTRRYDQRIDRAGFARTSDGVGGKLGSTFELTRLITGEISAGAVNRTYEDRRLRNLSSPVADAALAYALTPLTTIRATASVGVDETTIPNANGIRSVRGTLTASHDLLRNLTLTAGLTAADYDYQGVAINERSFGALFRADYRLTRQIALRASYNYENLKSTVAGSSYSTSVFLLGVRLQP